MPAADRRPWRGDVRVLAPLQVPENERQALFAMVQSGSPRQRLRAIIVLMAAAGNSNRIIAQTLATNPTMVGKWRKRYALSGMAGLVDHPRSGRPRKRR